MEYPILEFFDDEGIIGKTEFIHSILKNAIIKPDLEKLKKHKIDTTLLIFTRQLPEEILSKCEKFYVFKSVSNTNDVYIYDNKFLLAISPLGGPFSCGLMEELGFMGIKNFFACGSAGQIGYTIDPSKFVLIDRAIRDEGTSYHYLPASVYAETDKKLTLFMKKFLTKNHFEYELGTTWTTDCGYRETNKAVDRRKEQGAVAVEMECASWCAVAKYRKYKFAQLLYFSDVVKQKEWKSKDNRKELKAKVQQLMLQCVSEFVDEKNKDKKDKIRKIKTLL